MLKILYRTKFLYIRSLLPWYNTTECTEKAGNCRYLTEIYIRWWFRENLTPVYLLEIFQYQRVLIKWWINRTLCVKWGDGFQFMLTCLVLINRLYDNGIKYYWYYNVTVLLSSGHTRNGDYVCFCGYCTHCYDTCHVGLRWV